MFSLAHDLPDGGLPHALREAASLVEGRAAHLADHGGAGAGVLVAATERPAWPDLVELGTV